MMTEVSTAINSRFDAWGREMATSHVPVLVDEVLKNLLCDATRTVVDGTVGAGGHAEAILSARSDVTLIGVDRDPHAIGLAASRLERFGARVRLVCGVYSDLADAVRGERVDGVLLDLGVSSMQIDSGERGFSYSIDGPLDMRMSGDGRSAEALLRESDADELAGLLRELGGVRRPRQVARAIVRAVDAGELRTTGDLKRAVVSALGVGATTSELSRVFQSIRIAVNAELDLLKSFLENIIDILEPDGRIVIISYHSHEDRMVKSFFREQSADCLCPPGLPVCVCGHTARLELIMRRAIRPTKEEVAANPRSRSALLRAARVLEREALN